VPRKPFPLNHAQHDRAVGALLSTAVGDALGAGHVPTTPDASAGPVGITAPGEWTDAAATAIAVAEIASFDTNLTAPQRLDDLVQRWAWWARTAKAVGPQTAAVLAAIDGDAAGHVAGVVGAEKFHDAAAALYVDTGGTLDATCLTRAVPIALASLGPQDESSAIRTARTLCGLTHAGPDAAEATVLLTLAIRHAVLTGELDIGIGLPHLEANRRDVWSARIVETEWAQQADVAQATDDVVGVLQAAWSAITTTPVPQQDPRNGIFRADHLRLALEAAVRGGGHTATVGAVTGGLLGAAYGASAIPWQWRTIVRGWPGLRAHGLSGLADKIVNGGEPCRLPSIGWWRDEPDPRLYPHDDGVWIGVAARLEKLPPDIEAVVSLRPVPDEDMPAGVLHLEVRLADDAGNETGADAHLDFVLLDTVRAIEALRAAGVTVFLHGHATRSRAPAVAALYGARRAGIDIDQALAEVCAVLPDANPGDPLRAALHRLSPATERSAR